MNRLVYNGVTFPIEEIEFGDSTDPEYVQFTVYVLAEQWYNNENLIDIISGLPM